MSVGNLFLVNWLYDCVEKTQPVVMGLVFLPSLLCQARPLFYFPCTSCKKWCVFLTSFLHTRGELKGLGLTGERFPILHGNSGFLRHLLAVWVPTELTARRIEAAQDFQGFLMWSFKLFSWMSHIHLWEFLGYSVSLTSAVNEEWIWAHRTSEKQSLAGVSFALGKFSTKPTALVNLHATTL